jgi:hypothetical protein
LRPPICSAKPAAWTLSVAGNRAVNEQKEFQFLHARAFAAAQTSRFCPFARAPVWKSAAAPFPQLGTASHSHFQVVGMEPLLIAILFQLIGNRVVAPCLKLYNACHSRFPFLGMASLLIAVFISN